MQYYPLDKKAYERFMNYEVCIDYGICSHGRFLENILNHVYAGLNFDIDKRISTTGAIHGGYDEKIEDFYRVNRKFMAGHFYESHFEHLPNYPFPLRKNLITITQESKIEHTLVRQYWARKADNFFAGPEELCKMTYNDVLERKKYVKYYNPFKHPRIDEDKKISLERLISTVYDKIERGSLPNEYDIILYWISYFESPTWFDKDCIKIFADHCELDSTIKLFKFKMLWIYDDDQFLNGIKAIGNFYNYKQLCNDQEIVFFVQCLRKNIKELFNISKVIEKYNDIIENKITDFSKFNINDKIGLLNYIIVNKNISYKIFSEFKSFPNTTQQFIEILQ